MKRILTWSTIVWLVCFLGGCTLASQGTPPVATNEREPAPDFRLTTLDGQTVTLSDLQGRWVLINFWATWCSPCREELPYLQTLAATHADQLTILGINMRESETAIEPFVAELGLTFPILLQPDDNTLLNYGVRGLPLTFLIDPEGNLVWRQVGPFQSAAVLLRIKSAIGGANAEGTRRRNFLRVPSCRLPKRTIRANSSHPSTSDPLHAPRRGLH